MSDTLLTAYETTIFIDAFDVLQPSYSGSSRYASPTTVYGLDLGRRGGNLPGYSQTLESDDSIVGGFRDVNVTVTSAIRTGVAAVTVGGSSGDLNVSLNAGTEATATIVYDGQRNSSLTPDSLNPIGLDPTGAGVLDFTLNGNDSLVLDIVRAQSLLGSPINYTITVYTDGSNYSSLTRTSYEVLDVTDNGTIDGILPFAFSDFNDASNLSKVGNGVDFSDIGAIRIDITGPTAYDTQIDFFGVAKEVVDTPKEKPEVIPANLGNFVWNDRNVNGVQDEGELGVENVKVELLDQNNQVVDTAFTNNDGFYLFENLTPDVLYRVQFYNPSGYKFTKNDFGDDSKDSDAALVSGISAPVRLESGETNLTVDAGLYELASLGNFVWHDTNANGLRDENELGVENVTVKLLDINSDPITSTVTDANGGYLFDGLTPGFYQVQFVTPEGFAFTTANVGGDDTADSDADAATGFTQTVFLTPGEFNDTLDAGIYQPASLGDFVWFDVDADGIQDVDESGIEGVIVTLLDSENSMVGSVTTAANGSYKFANLVPGDYTVQFTAPEGYLFTEPNLGGDDATDSDADAATGLTQTVTLTSGEFNGTLDAGLTCSKVDLPEFRNALSNVVLYVLDESGAVTKVKIDSFSGEIKDADTLDFDGFIADNFSGSKLVALSIKAGNNKEQGMGPGEGEFFILDKTYTRNDFPLSAKADVTYQFGNVVNVLTGGDGLDAPKGGINAFPACGTDSGNGSVTPPEEDNTDPVTPPSDGGTDPIPPSSDVDLPEFRNALSNVVLYAIDSNNDVTKVKIDSFSGEIKDADILDFDGFITDKFTGQTLVALSIKAGNNKEKDLKMGPGEGEFFILDTNYTNDDFPLSAKADVTYTFGNVEGVLRNGDGLDAPDPFSNAFPAAGNEVITSATVNSFVM